MALIDSDPYEDGGQNWFVNQNNFFRAVHNIILDTTAVDPNQAVACIHWQVAQATSLQNLTFNMVKGGATNKQQGIFMDNGSGGFMSDLEFNGGNYSVFLGNQQFTTRNLKFRNCMTAIFMNWNWIWLFKSIDIQDCAIGLDISVTNQSIPTEAEQIVGSVILQDSKISATTGVKTAFKPSTFTNGTLIIDNVDFSGSKAAVADTTGNAVLAGGSKVASWAQGHGYSTGGDLTTKRAAGLAQIQLRGNLHAPTKPQALLDASGKFVERSRPQYENVPASSFVSIRDQGAKGDGTTDDTAAVQKALLSVCPTGNIVYFDHGAYLIKKTVTVPANCKIFGEMWPLIVADGKSFSDASKPTPVWQVGRPGDKGAVEITDMMFQTNGPAPGAIMMEWNLQGSSPGAAGMWNTHFRIGGTKGTNLEGDKCVKQPEVTAPAKAECFGTFMMLHITKTASLLMENDWMWVADHDCTSPFHLLHALANASPVDLAPNNQINIYNGRGVLVESQGPVWMYGTASEHSQLYNYQLSNATNVYMGVIQTESPYMQSNPDALNAFPPQATLGDPTFAECTDGLCKKAWGLRIADSQSVFIYGAGLYSFFENWDQSCVATHSCQTNTFSIDKCSSQVYMFTLATIATKNQVTIDGIGQVSRADNVNTFADTLGVFEAV